MKPEVSKYRYTIGGNAYQGIENSVAAYRQLAFFADNGGSVLALNLETHETAWALPATDDTDATIVVETENDVPYLYTGTEVDKQGDKGSALLRKIDGRTGRVVWQVRYPCFTIRGDRPVNGGLLATPVIGKRSIGQLVIYTLARYGTMNGGLMIALDKQSGRERWRLTMKHYAWSSPVDVYDERGGAYVLQADSAGTLSLIDAPRGKVLSSIDTGSNVEASPAVFDNYAVVASRGGQIMGFKLE